MGIQSHGRTRQTVAVVGRPPSGAAAPRGCRGVTTFGNRCNNYAHWLLPELAYCAHHVPADLIPLLVERQTFWSVLGAEAWTEVLAACPLPNT